MLFLGRRREKIYVPAVETENTWVQYLTPIKSRREETLSHPKPATDTTQILAETKR